jgi:hypothetical protein
MNQQMNKRIRELARETGIKMAQDQSMALGYLDSHKSDTFLYS